MFRIGRVSSREAASNIHKKASRPSQVFSRIGIADTFVRLILIPFVG